MKLGINLPFRSADGLPLDVAGIAERARRIEAAGFDSTWIPDTLLPVSQPRPDPMAWLLVAATATTKLELGTAICIVPTRNAVDLAQRVLTLHLITGGRFTFGVGAGSTAAAHEAAGVDFDGRFRTLHQSVDTIRRLCEGEQVGVADLQPWPEALGGPKILLGAWQSEVSLRKAVKSYDGWICSAGRTSLTVIAEGIKRYRDLGGTRAVVASCPVDLSQPTKRLDDDAPFDLICQPDDAAERLHMLAELGFDDVTLVKADVGGTARRYEVDPSVEQLEQIRSLLPAHS